MPGRHYSDRPHVTLAIKLDHSSPAPHSVRPLPGREPKSTEHPALESDQDPQAQIFPCSLTTRGSLSFSHLEAWVRLVGPRGPVLSTLTAGLVAVVVGCLATARGQAWVMAAVGGHCYLLLGPDPPLASKSPTTKGHSESVP